MNPTAYIETSVVSYLTARPSRDVVVAAYQEVTREWWRDAPERFHLVASELVVTESGAGDADAARARLKVLESVTLVNVSQNAEELTRHLLDRGAVPREAAADAAHIAINGVKFQQNHRFEVVVFLRSLEVVPVLEFCQPARSARRLARLAAGAGRAVPLVPQVPRVRAEQHAAVQALASSSLRHRLGSSSRR